MKKKLEGQLVSIAHRILKLKGKEDLIKMHKEVSNLYEVISAVKFLDENNFDKSLSEKEEQSSFWESIDTAFNNKVSDSIEVDDVVYVNVDDKKDTVEIEPAMEKIKDIVAQIPEETQVVDKMVQEILDKNDTKDEPVKQAETEEEVNVVVEEIEESLSELDELLSDFKDIPDFEPVNTSVKSLNDKLKKGNLVIGLNDKIAFTKHLFNGDSETFNAFIQQVNSVKSLNDVAKIIESIKLSFDWNDKLDYEERLMELIESKF